MSLEVQQVEWKMLAPHAERDALFLLSDAEDLLRVGQAIADNDTATVSGLIASGALTRPTKEQLDADGEASFDFLIVQPFVVAQGPKP